MNFRLTIAIYFMKKKKKNTYTRFIHTYSHTSSEIARIKIPLRSPHTRASFSLVSFCLNIFQHAFGFASRMNATNSTAHAARLAFFVCVRRTELSTFCASLTICVPCSVYTKCMPGPGSTPTLELLCRTCCVSMLCKTTMFAAHSTNICACVLMAHTRWSTLGVHSTSGTNLFICAPVFG